MTRPERRHLAFLFIAASAASLLAAAPAAAIPVFDPSNYAQNVLQAARSLEQIEHQIQSLQNEATMIQSMAKNLQRIDFPELQRMTAAMQKVDQLVGDAKGIDFRVDQLDTRLKAMFPGGVSGAGTAATRTAEAKARLDAATDAIRRSIAVQAQVAENVRGDAGLLDALVARSQGAEGALQAQQAASQLLALGAKQQMQLQTLLATQFRSDAIERARAGQAEAEARESTRRFLGTGRAYTPR
jgi:P-type conjugative transfer protein TrbJ